MNMGSQDSEDRDQIVEQSLPSKEKDQSGQEKENDNNVVDLASFHSKYSKNCFETASINKSVISSKMSMK